MRGIVIIISNEYLLSEIAGCEAGIFLISLLLALLLRRRRARLFWL